MEQVVALSIAEPRIYTFLLGAFASLAVGLAAVGLYGLVSYAASRRMHEMGVRVALGASRREILRLVLGHGWKLAAAGTVIGLAAAVAATRVLVGLIRGVEPNDPVTFGAVAGVLLLVALGASYIPARRAARLDPMLALRSE
jgi:putative ABC transport system permease protein